MIVKQINVGTMIETNCYFYIDEESSHGFLIDPADEADKLIDLINKNNWVIEKMLITHGHFDHIGAVGDIHQKLNIPYFIHQQGQTTLTDGRFNLSSMFGNEILLNEAHYLADGDFITLEANPEIKLQVIYTPGHTTDGVIYYDKNQALAFVGDTIFKGSVGRTDFPGGDWQILDNSIRQKILTLPDNTVLYSGHSEPTTVEAERKYYRRFF